MKQSVADVCAVPSDFRARTHADTQTLYARWAVELEVCNFCAFRVLAFRGVEYRAL